MKRVRMEVIYHVADSADEKLVHDKLKLHMKDFPCPGRSHNAAKPHYESIEVAIERCRWEPVR